MKWENVSEIIIGGLILSAITGVVGLIYKHRKGIAHWYKKCKIKYFPIKFNVALSIQFDKQFNSGRYFNEIKKQLIGIIEQMGLSNIIVLKDFSDIYLFPDKKEAEAYRQKKNLDLIVWGEFSEDGLKIDNQDINKMNLNFTYGYPRDTRDKENRLGKAIILDINSRLALKNYWQIVDGNSYKDVEIISNNLSDISLYIVGLTLKFYGRLEESQEIFEKLFQKLNIKEDDFKNLVIPHLLDCYFLFIRDITLSKKNFEKGIEYCNKMLALSENNHFALSNIAVFYYKTGDMKKCEEIVEKLLKLYPKDPITEIDVAFIRIMQKRYKNAFKHYNKVLSMEAVSFNPQEVIEFLGAEYEKCGEPALLYGSGIISYRFGGDKELTRMDLELFLKKANEKDYKEMYRKTKKILAEIKI